MGGAGSEAGSRDEAGQAAHCQDPWLDFKPQPQVESKTVPSPSLLSKSLRQDWGMNGKTRNPSYSQPPNKPLSLQKAGDMAWICLCLLTGP